MLAKKIKAFLKISIVSLGMLTVATTCFASVFVRIGAGPGPGYYGPPPVYYGPAPAYYPPVAPSMAWVPGHWDRGFWVPGQYIEYAYPVSMAAPAPYPNVVWVEGNWDHCRRWHHGYWGHR